MKYERIEKKNGVLVHESCNFNMENESAKKRFEKEYDEVCQDRRNNKLKSYNYDFIDKPNEYYRAFCASYNNGFELTIVIYE